MIYHILVKFYKDFVKVGGNSVTVGVMAQPKRGLANKEIIVKLAEYFKVPKANVKILRGLRSKRKIVEIIK